MFTSVTGLLKRNGDYKVISKFAFCESSRIYRPKNPGLFEDGDKSFKIVTKNE